MLKSLATVLIAVLAFGSIHAAQAAMGSRGFTSNYWRGIKRVGPRFEVSLPDGRRFHLRAPQLRDREAPGREHRPRAVPGSERLSDSGQTMLALVTHEGSEPHLLVWDLANASGGRAYPEATLPLGAGGVHSIDFLPGSESILKSMEDGTHSKIERDATGAFVESAGDL